MTFTEIQSELQALTPEDKRRAAAYLIHQLRAGDPEYQEEMAHRHEAMDQGKKVSFSEFKTQLFPNGG